MIKTFVWINNNSKVIKYYKDKWWKLYDQIDNKDYITNINKEKERIFELYTDTEKNIIVNWSFIDNFIKIILEEKKYTFPQKITSEYIEKSYLIYDEVIFFLDKFKDNNYLKLLLKSLKYNYKDKLKVFENEDEYIKKIYNTKI